MVAALLLPALAVLEATVAVGPVLLLDLHGRRVDPFAGTDRVAVFVFLGRDCPISNRYAPEIQRLARAFGRRGVTLRLVYPDRDTTPDAIRAHLREYGHSLTALRDPQHNLVALSGVTVTPEAAVFDRRRLVYRGRIDDRYVHFGVLRPEPSVQDVEHVLESLLDGHKIAPFTRPAVGCLIAGTPRLRQRQ